MVNEAQGSDGIRLLTTILSTLLMPVKRWDGSGQEDEKY
jgi:hypothetical protein